MDIRSKNEGTEDDAMPSSCSDCVTGGSGTGAASAILGSRLGCLSRKAGRCEQPFSVTL